MTYKEANLIINDNRDKALSVNRDRKPYREVWGFFIAPLDIFHDTNMKQYLFEQCILNNGSNENALLDLGNNFFFSNKLAPFIVLRMNGQPITLLLAHYLLTDELSSSSGNAS